MKTALSNHWPGFALLPLMLLTALPGLQPAWAATLVPGGLWREVYTNVPGPSVADLTNSAKFPSHPDLTEVIGFFETPSDSGEAYGQRLSGAILPPVTGPYIFYVASDDQSVLFLSPDTDPAHKVAIAREDNWIWARAWTGLGAGRTNQANISAPIYLEAGKAYYIEALHKEAMGGDHFGVAWQMPGDPVPENMSPPIPGAYLARFVTDDSSVVTTTADSGPGSLREVVAGLAPGGKVTFGIAGAVTLTSGPISIGKSLTMAGPGAHVLAIERSSAPGTPFFRIFEVTAGTVIISDLAIRGGNVTATNGSEFGGAIVNRGSLVLNRCVLSDNEAPGEYSRGGAICTMMEGRLAANACTFMQNRASGRDGEAGAIYNYGYLALTNCTFNGNSAGGWGGAVHNDMLSKGVWMDSCTFTGNEGSSGGAIFNRGAPPYDVSPVYLRNSIFVGNAPEDIAHCSIVRSSGYNLIGTLYEMNAGTIYPFVPQIGDRTNVTSAELRLGSLAMNGGPTPTQAPLRHSPVIDNGPASSFPATDQRGVARPFGVRCDIGAVESDQIFPNQAPTLACPGRTSWQATSAQGAIGTLTVAAGDPDGDELLVTWSADGVPGQTNRIPAGASTNASVTLTLSLAVGQHTVLASVSDGEAAAVSCSTLVEVLPPPPHPLIVQPPFSQTRFVGQPVAFKVQAQSASPITYQWLLNGAPIPGATDSSYSTPATQAAVVSVAVGDSSGSITSPPARLTVLARPTGPGSLDPSFDPTFMNQLSGLTEGQGRILCLARQPDGKVIVGGSFTALANRPRNNLARLNPDGTVDETFNPGYGTDGLVQDIAILPDGRILVVGYFTSANGAPRDGIARLYSDGTVDPDFHPSVKGYGPISVSLQTDGKVLIGGPFTNVCGVARKAVARLNADGTLDPAFDASTVVRSEGASISSLAVQADGRILIGGHFTPGVYDRPLACLLPDGTPDPGFLIPSIREESTVGWVMSLALDSQGRILLGGRFWSVNGTPRPALARLLFNGVLDNSFVPGDLDQKYVNKVAVAPGDKVLAGGAFTVVDGNARQGLARFNADGSFDPTFDASDAMVRFTKPWINTFLVDSNSVLVSAGLADNYPYQGGHPLFQVLPDGTLDPAYKMPNVSHQAAVSRIAVQPDGRVLVLANEGASANGGVRGPLFRLLPNGTRDPGFVRTVVEGNGSCVALQPDGKILLGGQDFTVAERGVLRGIIRLNADGTLDPSFENETGTGEYPLWIWRMALQPDGRILVIGEFETIRGGQRSYMARLNANGSLDESFTLDPSLNVLSGEYNPPLNCVAVEPDGKILLGGYFNDVEAGLVQLLPNGTLDRELVGPGLAGEVAYLAQQPDGKIVVGGRFRINGGGEWNNVIRINADGGLDTVFDCAFNHIRDMALQPDGKVLVAVGAASEALVRCLPNGSRDPSFVPNLWSGPGPAYFQVIALQPDGEVLVAGALTTADGIPWNGIARLNNVIERPQTWVIRQLPAQHAPPGPTVRLLAQPPAAVAVYAVEEQPPANWRVANISHGGIFDPANGKVKFGPYFDNEGRTLTYDVFPPLGYQGVGKFAGTASADGASSPVVGDDTWVIAGPHPADLNPVDWRLGMDELTAYGAAWRTGGVWSCEPNPIPITYVSRAAALWRGGETYTVDPSITTPPLWWVNRLGSGGPSAKFDLGLTGTAQRSLPAGFLATEPVDVTLSVKPVSTTSAYAVEESVPAGARLVSVADGGALDALQSRVKWGPYLDNSPRVLRYRVVLPQPEGGLLQFAGAASFDGDLVTTLGPNKVRSTSLLTCGAPPQSGQWDLLLRGDLGAVYELQVSTDLARWTALSRFTNSSGTVRIPLSIVPGTTQLYYRANLVSP